jgi:hypothetical protein
MRCHCRNSFVSERVLGEVERETKKSFDPVQIVGETQWLQFGARQDSLISNVKVDFVMGQSISSSCKVPKSLE